MVNHLNVLINQAWNRHAKQSRISKHSKQWQNEDCSKSLNEYRTTRSLENWKRFKKVIKNSKRSFFDLKIQEVVNKSCRPWELIYWVNKCKLPAVEAIKFNNQPYLTPESLWGALHTTFNTTLLCQVDTDILNELGNKPTLEWALFSREEFRQALLSCNNILASSPNKISQYYLKSILKQDTYLYNLINIANACIFLGHWPTHFKLSFTIIIPKPNKPTYNHPKSF